jgi:uncharacterized membrane protein YphA (DoxX/SURF4 family)
MRIVKIIAAWMLRIAFAGLCLLVGTGKIRRPELGARRFAEWGYPAGSHMVVGVLEIIGGVLILVPRSASYGSLLIMTVMVGAIGTHLTHGETRRVISPVGFLLIAAGVGWLRRHDAKPVVRPRKGERAVI